MGLGPACMGRCEALCTRVMACAEASSQAYPPAHFAARMRIRGCYCVHVHASTHAHAHTLPDQPRLTAPSRARPIPPIHLRLLVDLSLLRPQGQLLLQLFCTPLRGLRLSLSILSAYETICSGHPASQACSHAQRLASLHRLGRASIRLWLLGAPIC